MSSRRFSTGSVFLLVLMAIGVLLVGCVSMEERQQRALKFMDNMQQSASGAINETVGQVKGVIDTGRGVVGTVQEGVTDVKRRVDAVEEGLKKIQEGKELIDEGLGGGDD